MTYERSNKQLLHRAPCTQLTISRDSTKKQCLKYFLRSINKSSQWDSPKVVSSKCSTEGAMRSYFSRAPCTQLNISRGPGKMQCFGKLSQVLINLSGRLSQSSYFKAFYERSNVQLLSQRTLYMTFCQQTFIRNTTLSLIVLITGKIYQ